MFANKLVQAIKQSMKMASVINAEIVPRTEIVRVPPEFVGTHVDISFVINADGRAVPCLTLRNPRRTRVKPQ